MDHVGLVDIVITTWVLYVMLLFVKMEVSVKTLMTRITTHVLVSLASLGGTVNFDLILVTALHVNKVEHALSLEVVMTSNVLVHKVSKSELMDGDTKINEC